MSFASTAAPAARTLLGATQGVLRGATLQAMGRTVGVVAAAGALAAVYQIAATEGQAAINTLRFRTKYRQERNARMLIQVLGRGLSAPVQQQLLKSRDVFQTAITLLADDGILNEDRDLLREALDMVARNEA